MAVTTKTGSTFNTIALGTNPDIVIDQSIKSAWGETKRDNELVSTMMMLESSGKFGQSIKAKEPKWAIGEYPDEKAVLNSALAYDATSIDFGSDYDRFFDQDVVRISDGTHEAIVRVGAKTGSGVYNCSILSTDKSSSTFATTSEVDVIAPATTYDDSARDYLNVKPNLIYNRMQRMRDTVGAGQWERGEMFLADHSLEGLVRKGFKSFARKINKSIYCNSISATAASGSSEDYGIMGGLPYFLNPKNLGSVTTGGGTRNLASADYAGVNRVDAGATVSLSNLNAWSTDLFERGSEMKMLFCSPYFYGKIRDALYNNVNIYRESLGALNNGFSNAWSHDVIDLSFGRLMIVPDRGATGIYQNVITDSANNSSSQLNWAVAVDPADVGFSYYIPEGEGAQTPHIRDIDKLRNTSIEEVEFDATMTMVLGDPRLHGYYGITGS